MHRAAQIALVLATTARALERRPKITVVGSANLDNRSFRLNFEVMVLTVDRAFAGEVETMLEADFAQAYEVDANEYRQSPAWRRIAMHVARLFAPIL